MLSSLRIETTAEKPLKTFTLDYTKKNLLDPDKWTPVGFGNGRAIVSQICNRSCKLF